MRSKAHILRDSRYKHVNAKSGGTSREKSEGVIVLVIIETTQLDGKEGPLLQPSHSREVSDGACPQRANSTSSTNHDNSREGYARWTRDLRSSVSTCLWQVIS